MSLIIAYALTIVGLIFAGVHDFAGMGIFLTAIGVVITLVHGLRAKYKPVALVAALAVHAALWIVPNFSPELVGKLIGAAIGIPIAAALVIGVLLPLVQSMFGSEQPAAPARPEQQETPGEFDITALPDIVYDSNNQQWQRYGVYGDHVLYRSADGQEVNVYNAQISGKSANTDKGSLHWY